MTMCAKYHLFKPVTGIKLKIFLNLNFHPNGCLDQNHIGSDFFPMTICHKDFFFHGMKLILRFILQ